MRFKFWDIHEVSNPIQTRYDLMNRHTKKNPKRDSKFWGVSLRQFGLGEVLRIGFSIFCGRKEGWEGVLGVRNWVFYFELVFKWIQSWGCYGIKKKKKEKMRFIGACESHSERRSPSIWNLGKSSPNSFEFWIPKIQFLSETRKTSPKKRNNERLSRMRSPYSISLRIEFYYQIMVISFHTFPPTWVTGP